MTASDSNSNDKVVDQGVTIIMTFPSWSLSSTAIILTSATAATAVGGFYLVKYTRKRLRSKWLQDEEYKERKSMLLTMDDDDGDESDGDNGKEGKHGASGPVQSLPGIIEHFRELELTAQSTIFESNRRRTTSYYEKAREAHLQSLVPGVTSYSKLLDKRRNELSRLRFYYTQGKKSLRTVVVMCDAPTQQLLVEARQRILAPLHYSWDIYTKGVWVPSLNVIPKHDMHVTIAVPWWWHTIKENNAELSRTLALRLKHALLVDFHHPFLIELERIVLLGGKTLVALWRTVGERTILDRDTNEEVTLVDRHSTDIDPMVRLRREIVHCFTTEREEYRTKPLTHHHHKQQLSADLANAAALAAATIPSDLGDPSPVSPLAQNRPDVMSRSNSLPTPDTTSPSKMPAPPPPIPKPNAIQAAERRHTIELKTPGLGSGDGFIHTTLCRLPLDCLSSDDVELEPIHRLCREATATYAGHRMLIRGFRLLETTCKGGESNPCTAPLFDETIVAPTKAMVDTSGNVHSVLPSAISRDNLASTANAIPEERNAMTIGAIQAMTTGGGLEGLFQQPL
ncbi:MAG: hypothetical protein SGILL_007981 [Bacillariaceae sp.]